MCVCTRSDSHSNETEVCDVCMSPVRVARTDREEAWSRVIHLLSLAAQWQLVCCETVPPTSTSSFSKHAGTILAPSATSAPDGRNSEWGREGWRDVQEKGTSSAHLFISQPSLPPHLPCLTRLVLNAEPPLSASRGGAHGEFQWPGKHAAALGARPQRPRVALQGFQKVHPHLLHPCVRLTQQAQQPERTVLRAFLL